MQSIKKLLSEQQCKVYTLTPDRGKEFSKRYQITCDFGIPFYFPDAHAPWKRGSNENTNGLIRECIPKNTEIADYSDDYINTMVKQIDNRPRKCFIGYQRVNLIFLKRST